MAKKTQLRNFLTLWLWSFGGAFAVVFVLALIGFLNLNTMFNVILQWDLLFWQIANAVLVIGFSTLGILYAARKYQIVGSRSGALLGGLVGFAGGCWPSIWSIHLLPWSYFNFYARDSIWNQIFSYALILVPWLTTIIFTACGTALGYWFATKLIKQDYGK
jgi:hypothetical protein